MLADGDPYWVTESVLVVENLSDEAAVSAEHVDAMSLSIRAQNVARVVNTQPSGTV